MRTMVGPRTVRENGRETTKQGMKDEKDIPEAAGQS
jgi:hypothetical protein